MKERVLESTPPALKKRILSAVRAVKTETIPIASSRGRILAESLRAPHSVPEMNRTVMDGYAVRHTDLRTASSKHPVCLISTANIGAGHSIRKTVPRGHAVRIMTGAPMPAGTDSIVRMERVRVEGDKVWFEQSVAKYKDVRRSGSEIRRNQVVLRRGQTIGPVQMAMLAFIDLPRVKVYRRPRVALLSTGDELGPVGKKRPYGHIPDSNRYGLIGLVESAGCVPVDGGRVGDTPETLLAALKKVTRRADFILTTGGVSAGDFDVVKVVFWPAGESGIVDGGFRFYRASSPAQTGRGNGYRVAGMACDDHRRFPEEDPAMGIPARHGHRGRGPVDRASGGVSGIGESETHVGCRWVSGAPAGFRNAQEGE